MGLCVRNCKKEMKRNRKKCASFMQTFYEILHTCISTYTKPMFGASFWAYSIRFFLIFKKISVEALCLLLKISDYYLISLRLKRGAS